MAIPSVQDSSVYVNSAGASGAAASEIAVTRHQCDPNPRLTDVTTTASGNGTSYSNVRYDPRWTFEAPLDAAAYLQDLGFTSGATIVDLYFRHSTSGGAIKGDKVSGTTVASVEEVTDATNDVTRIRVSGQGGTYAANQTIPGAT